MASPFSTTWRKEFIFFSTNLPSSQSRRLEFLTCYLDPPSSSSSCCSSSCSSSSSPPQKIISFRRCGGLKKSLEIEISRSGSLSATQSRSFSKENGSNKMVRERPVGREKKPFWRKVLFASKKVKSIILLNVIAVVYASDILVVKGAEATMDPAAFSAVRFVMSAVPFLPFVFRARDDVRTRNAGIELGFWLSLAYFIEAIGLLTSEAGRASFISLVTVIAVPLLDGVLGAIIPARTWFGVLMSAIGVAVLECSGSPPNIGDLLNFLNAIFFGIHMLRTEHISRSTEKENFMALLGYETCVVALLSTIWVLLGGWFYGEQDFNQSTWASTELWDWIVAFPWIPALYTGVFSTGICSFIEVHLSEVAQNNLKLLLALPFSPSFLWKFLSLQFAAMRDVSATETAIIYGLEPVWGAGFAWFLLGERWGALGWIGATLVLGGSLMVQMFGSSPTKKPNEAEEGHEQLLKNGLSASPIVVRSTKDVAEMLK